MKFGKLLLADFLEMMLAAEHEPMTLDSRTVDNLIISNVLCGILW